MLRLLAQRMPAMREDCDALYRRDRGFQQLKPLSGDFEALIRDSGHVATGMRQALNETIGYGIGDPDEHYGHGLRRPCHGQRPGRPREDHFGFSRDQLICEGVESLLLAFREAILDGQVLSRNEPGLGETAQESLVIGRRFLALRKITKLGEKANAARGWRWLLRADSPRDAGRNECQQHARRAQQAATFDQADRTPPGLSLIRRSVSTTRSAGSRIDANQVLALSVNRCALHRAGCGGSKDYGPNSPLSVNDRRVDLRQIALLTLANSFYKLDSTN